MQTWYIVANLPLIIFSEELPKIIFLYLFVIALVGGVIFAREKLLGSLDRLRRLHVDLRDIPVGGREVLDGLSNGPFFLNLT